MLAKRVIPTLLMRGPNLYKGERFNAWRQVGHVAQAVRVHQRRGVDELVLLDVGATPDGRGPDFAAIERLSSDCFMPLAVGGGVRSVEDVRALLRAGADKVVLGTAATMDPALVCRVSSAVGNQAVVVSVEVRADDFRFQICSECGRRRWMFDPVEWCVAMQGNGAGEILLTSIDREGTMSGYDLGLISAVARAVSIPVIAHGGAGTYEHMREAIEAGADAVAAGAMFAFTDQTPRGAAEYLAKAGVEVRL